jgi:hypothetical protein
VAREDIFYDEIQDVKVDPIEIKEDYQHQFHSRSIKRSIDRAIASEEKSKERKKKGRENFMSYIENKNDTKKNNQIVNKGSSGYMAQDNVKEFNKAMQKRIFNASGIGRPYKFGTVEELQEDMTEYFDLCAKTNTVPTLTSLALYLGVDTETINNHATNSNSPFFDVMKNTKTYLHSVMQNGTLDGKINPVTYIFLSKNFYGMRDDKNITVTPNSDKDPINSSETMAAIQKQLQEETIPNADFRED